MVPPVRTEDLDTGDVTLSCAVAGADDHPVVLALHGFPDSRASFRPLVPALTAAGYRVVLPTLRGYAPSGLAKSGRHHALGAGDDLLWLADHYAPQAPVRLVGHDWGAVAAFNAVARAPQRFSHLVSMAVPHPAVLLKQVTPAQLARSWYMAMFQVPLLAESQLKKDDFALIDRLWRDWSPSYTPTKAELDEVKAGIRERVGPVLAYYRALLSPKVQAEAQINLRPVEVPALHLHGADDGCVGVECSDDGEAYYRRGYARHVIAGAGHFLVQEKPDAVAAILTAFFATTTESAAAASQP